MSDARATDRDSAEPQQWHRCFIALAPDAPTRHALATLEVPPRARRVPQAQLHLTVAFIGAMSFEQGDALARGLAIHAPHARPMPRAEVTKLDYWPKRATPRLMVAVLAMSEAFAALDRRVRALLGEAGLPLDARAFRPHVTLARFPRDAAAVPAIGEDTALPAPLRFESLVLYSSTLAKQGARYEALAVVKLD
ncbi:RNA 2',3'-cyclic phosphodiesterase [Paraburkholderia acidisoli]|uniref:RNA 2',3'-cyclic phosphodiesterase n=1 Tax=Paraburkholderia acidisoli TaxID=2571748 RepID=A0A7Z2JEP9_9BURK|nr:RNA 2',3'-cyclic phosphodiesterase [Paraburkholderia acidisoli]QGZ62512.1 RNA 2',3'-cyclic phosphodiesterase [Paraburkholderia acidisoli]